MSPRESAPTCAPITPDSPHYPTGPRAVLGRDAPATLTAIGNPAILANAPLALLCSVRCPGAIILKAYDLAVALRDNGVPVAGGFHSPMERECLRVLLRGAQPVIVCPARGVEGMRVPAAWRTPIEQGRLLIVSPFQRGRRATQALAVERNRFVAALAAAVFVAHATPGGKTEALCREVVTWGKPLYTFDTPDNDNLLALGALPCDSGHISVLGS
ncbi:MAG: DNA-processing protein DprA [Ktedonobacterales bacterium]